MKRKATPLFLLVLGLGIASASAETNVGQEQEDPFAGRHWKAFVLPHGERHRLRVEGILPAPSPGHYAVVKPAQPQGTNARILILELKFEALPGFWPQVITDIPACFDQAVRPDQYDQVTIRTPQASRTLEIIRSERQ